MSKRGEILAISYDDFGRVDTHATVNSSQEGVDFTYSYDNNSNIVTKVFGHRSGTPSDVYAYDNLNRLTNSSYAYTSGAEQFNYDILGNRDSVVDSRSGGGTCNYISDIVNQYTSVCGTGVSYDERGNLAQDKDGYTYHYDCDNRLVQIKKTNDTVLVASYTYDAIGRRVEKYDAVAGTTTRYYYDGQRVLLETSVAGETETDQRYFVYGNYIDEVLVMNDTSDDYYYAHDHLFSPVALFAFENDSWGLAERYEYDAYGTVRIMNASYEPRATSDYDNPYMFTGRRLDFLDSYYALKLYYYRARSYDSQTGRFLQRDPMQYVDGMNLYEYVNGNPIRKLDPSGLRQSECSCVGKTGGYQHSLRRRENLEYQCVVVGETILDEVLSITTLAKLILKYISKAASVSVPVAAGTGSDAEVGQAVLLVTTNWREQYIHRKCCEPRSVDIDYDQGTDYAIIQNPLWKFEDNGILMQKGIIEDYKEAERECRKIVNNNKDTLFPAERYRWECVWSNSEKYDF